MSSDKSDLTIAWVGPHDAEPIEHIQVLMDTGATFHRIEQIESRKIHKRLKGDLAARMDQKGQKGRS